MSAPTLPSGNDSTDWTSARSAEPSCASTASTRSCGKSWTRSAKSSASICRPSPISSGSLEQRDERGAHGVGELEQHGAAPLARDELPGRHALLLPQALEHERGVGRVQLIQLLLELHGVLPLDERLHERVLARVGARDELVHERLLVEQRDDGAQRRIESLLMLEIAGHGQEFQ